MNYNLPKIGQRVRTKNGVVGEVRRIDITAERVTLWVQDDGDMWDPPDTWAYDADGWKPV